MVALFTFWNTRQATQIKALSDAAERRKQERLAERESDRADKDAKQKEFEFWRDNYGVLSKQYTEEHGAYVALATKHDEFRRDFDTTKTQLQDVTKLSERQSQELIHLKGEQDKALTTISSMHEERLAADRTYVNEISTMNDDSARKQADLQRQIDRLTQEVRAANEEIRKLTVQVQDMNGVTMQMERKIRGLETERDQLLLDKAALQGQLAALLPPTEPDPPPSPDHKAAIPLDSADSPDLTQTERAA